MRKPPTLCNNNGALQVRVRINGRDHFINRLGCWCDGVARARAEAIVAEMDASFYESLKPMRGFELLVEGSDGISNEVGISGVEGSAGDGIFELALDGSDQGFGGGAEVHGRGWGLWGLVGAAGWYWAVVMACRLSWAGGVRCRRLNEV